MKSMIITLLIYKILDFSLSMSMKTRVTYYQTKLLLTVVALTMACTPFLWEFGLMISKKIEEKSDSIHYSGQDHDCLGKFTLLNPKYSNTCRNHI